ncbi:energy transducer TonB [Endozoicomonadaceae bacterium StTr2]
MAAVAAIRPGSADRLGFAVFLALAVHGMVLLGLGFKLPDHAKPEKTLEITLATYKSEKAPDNADYLAQINQQGSGTLDEKARPSSDQQAEFQDNKINEVNIEPQQAAQPEQKSLTANKVTTQKPTEKRIKVEQQRQDESQAISEEKPQRRIDLTAEVASLEADYFRKRQEYAKRPRIQRLNAASTRQEKGAFYQEAWRRKVERIGNLNYPEAARDRRLYGALRLKVTIRRDGTLKNVAINESSGQKLLDDAAIRIVKLAAPYAPFSDDLNEFDELEIIRTWRFEPGDQLFSE